MKIKHLLSIVLVSIVINANGQKFELGFEGDLIASGLKGNLFFPLLLNKEVNNEIKLDISANLFDRNKFGSTLNFRLKYQFKNEFGLILRNHSKLVGEISKSSLNLLLFGNSPYAGEILDLSPTSIKLFNYSEIGIYKTFGNYWAGVSLLIGNSFQEVSLNKAKLYTAEDGSYIDLNMDFENRKSDTSNTGFGAINGIGAALNFGYNTKNLQIEVRDLGLIKWNDNSLAIRKQGNYRYEGFDVSDPRNLEEVFLSESSDSIVDAFSSFSKSSYSQQIIGSIRAVWTLNSHWTFAGRYDFNQFNLPEITSLYTFGNSGSNASTYFSPSVTIGGYGIYGIGFSFYSELASNFQLEISTRHLQALVLPKNTNGLSLAIKISKPL